MAKKQPRRIAQGLSHHVNAGFQMVGTVLLGLLADHWLDTSPWLLLTGIFLGLFGFGHNLYKLIRFTDQERAYRKRKNANSDPDKP